MLFCQTLANFSTEFCFCLPLTFRDYDWIEEVFWYTWMQNQPSWGQKKTKQNETKKPKFDVAKVTANRANLLIAVGSLILYFKTFYASHLLNLWSFTCLLRLYHINKFESVQIGKLYKEGSSQQGQLKHHRLAS